MAQKASLSENDTKLVWSKEEYRSLMQEVLHNREKQSQAFLYGLIATCALLGFAASYYGNLSPLTFLLPIIILLPVTFTVICLRNAVDRIGAYVRVRFAETGLSYERSIHRFRWPLGFVSYIPIFKLMVWANLRLSFACIGIAVCLYIACLFLSV